MSQDGEVIRAGMTIADLREKYGRHEFDESDSRPLISTHLVIEGETLVPDECTRALGLEPTRTDATLKQTGRNVATGEPFYRRPSWVIGFEKEPSYSTDDELRRLLDRIWAKRARICSFLKDHDIEGAFVTTVTIHEDRPLYELKADTLSQLAYFELEWSLDIFDYSE